MLPVGSNLKSTTCALLSSNCVIWHGADIPCLSLCKDDTLTDIILKMGEYVCNLDVRAATITVNTECLGSGAVSWTNYNDLIQYITDKLCELTATVNNLVIPPTPSLTCSVATCLQSAAGGSTLGVVAYAELLGNEVCTLKSDIESLQLDVDSNTTDITNINNVLTTLPSTYAPINSSYVCLSTGSDSLVNIISTIEQTVCDLQTALGSSSEIIAAAIPYCNLNNENALNATGTMSSAYSEWNDNPSTLAESFTNMWITICDMREYVKTLAACCSSTCADIVLGFQGSVNAGTGIMTIEALSTSTIPNGYVQCNSPQSTITIAELSNTASGQLYESYTVPFNDIAAVVNGGSLEIDLNDSPLELANDFTVTINWCFFNNSTGSQCEGEETFNVFNTTACPEMTITPTWDSGTSTGGFDYSFNNIFIASDVIKYKVTVVNEASPTVIVAQTTTNTASTLGATVTGSFTGLNQGDYRIAIQILDIDTNLGTDVYSVIRACPIYYETIATTECIAPTNLRAFNIF